MKPLLIFVNPFSGKKQALRIYDDYLAPLLTQARIPHSLVVTEFMNHARSLVQDIDTKDWGGIIVVSGDGLIFEVINGLMCRSDWRKAISLPIGFMPGGTGNAVAASVAFAGGLCTTRKLAHSCAQIIIHPDIIPYDLMLVETQTKRYYSMLFFNWGFVSDIDIESELYRFMGPARLAIGTVVRLIRLRSYRGRLSFLPVEVDVTSTWFELSHHHHHHHHHHQHQQEQLSSRLSVPDFDVFRPSNFTRSRSFMDPASMNNRLDDDDTSSISSSFSVSGGSESGEEECTNGNFFEAKSSSDDDEEVCSSAVEADNSTLTAEYLPTDKPRSLLPPLDEPVPSNWFTIETDFINIIVQNCSHIADDLCMCKESRLNDGCLYLGMLYKSCPRSTMVKFLQAAGKNQPPLHGIPPNIERVAVKAFRLEPMSRGSGIMTLDGELIEYGKLQAEVVPGLGRHFGLGGGRDGVSVSSAASAVIDSITSHPV